MAVQFEPVTGLIGLIFLGTALPIIVYCEDNRHVESPAQTYIYVYVYVTFKNFKNLVKLCRFNLFNACFSYFAFKRTHFAQVLEHFTQAWVCTSATFISSNIFIYFFLLYMTATVTCFLQAVIPTKICSK